MLVIREWHSLEVDLLKEMCYWQRTLMFQKPYFKCPNQISGFPFLLSMDLVGEL